MYTRVRGNIRTGTRTRTMADFLVLKSNHVINMKRKDKENSRFPDHGLRVVSRLKLSRSADLDIVSAGSDSFLIVSHKNTQPTVIQLSQGICEESSLMKVSRDD